MRESLQHTLTHDIFSFIDDVFAPSRSARIAGESMLTRVRHR
jgi:hypothetical protein